MIKFDVKYYDNKQKILFQKSPFFNKIQKVITDGIEIDEHEFEIYTNFIHQKPFDGWRTKKDLKAHFGSRMDTFRDYFDYSSGSISAYFRGQNNVPNHLIERAGVGVSLIVMNEIFDLHEADWEKIGITRRADLDFRASTGNHFVEVEAKGTIHDEESINSSISQQKKSILKKKETKRNVKISNSSMFGVITSFPCEQNRNATCRLLDPPSTQTKEDPLLYKILSRLYFYWKNLRIISDTDLLLALRNRIQALENVSNYKDFDGLQLLSRNGKPFSISEKNYPTKTMSFNNKILGDVFPLSQTLLFYYAFDFEVLKQIKNQKFTEINNYKSKLPPFLKNISTKAHIHIDDLKRFKITQDGIDEVKGTKYYIAPIIGSVYNSKSGRSIGYFKIDNEGL